MTLLPEPPPGGELVITLARCFECCTVTFAIPQKPFNATFVLINMGWTRPHSWLCNVCSNQPGRRRLFSADSMRKEDK